MKYLILLISIVTLSSCSNNEVGRYQQFNNENRYTILDTKTGDLYWVIKTEGIKKKDKNTYKWVKKVEFD